MQTINPPKTRISIFLRWLRNPKICRISNNEGAVYTHVYFDNSLPIAGNFSFISVEETDVCGDIFFTEDIPLCLMSYKINELFIVAVKRIGPKHVAIKTKKR